VVDMPTITLSVPENLKREMEQFREINWSEVSREAISEKIKKLELLKVLDKLASKSELTDKDCLELGKKVNKNMLKKLKDKGLI